MSDTDMGVGNDREEDDARLWSRVAAQLDPLKSTEARLKDAARKAALNQSEPAPKKPPIAKPVRKSARPVAKAPVQPPPGVSRQPAEDRRGRVAGVDRRTAERLRKGQFSIDAKLDLHGLNQAQAHNALRLFIRQCHAARKRCLLVITGKGGRQRSSDDGPYVNAPAPGILKRAVPNWLRESELAPLVLATSAATPEHGGGGAMYVLLKRQRPDDEK